MGMAARYGHTKKEKTLVGVPSGQGQGWRGKKRFGGSGRKRKKSWSSLSLSRPPFLLSSFPFLSPPSLPFALVLSPLPCPVAAATHVRGGIRQEPSGGNDLLLRTENGGNGNVRFPFTVW